MQVLAQDWGRGRLEGSASIHRVSQPNSSLTLQLAAAIRQDVNLLLSAGVHKAFQLRHKAAASARDGNRCTGQGARAKFQSMEKSPGALRTKKRTVRSGK